MEGTREQRLVFGEVGDEYDRYRPGYPDELFDAVLDGVDDVIGLRATIDIGAGTGRCATALARRDVHGLAIEPAAGMADVLSRRLPERWTIEHGDFETCDAEGRSDWRLLTCAQAWHWVRPDDGFARAAALLGGGGRLALFWNRPAFRPDALRTAMDRIYDRLAPDMESSLRSYEQRSKGEGSIDLDRPPPGFSTIEFDEFTWTATYRTAEWLGLLGTHSDHRLLDPLRRAQLHGEIGRLIDAAGGTFELPYRVELLRIER